MLVVVLLTAGGIWVASYQHRIARSLSDRALAFQAAEAALRDAELSIMCKRYGTGGVLGACVAGAGSPAAPACLPGCDGGPPDAHFAVGFQPFAPPTGSARHGLCANGLCTPLDTQVIPTWEAVNWAVAAAPDSATETATTLPIGYLTGHPGYATGTVVPGIPPTRQPRFLLEAVPARCDPAHQLCTYRITATGWGNTSDPDGEPAFKAQLQELFRP